MKLQHFIIVIILSISVEIINAKAVETETEEFECIANYLREKKILDKSFKYFVQAQPLDCDAHISEIRETWLNNTLRLAFGEESSNEDDDKDLTEFKAIYSQDPACIHDQLLNVNYSDVLMQIYVYKKSRSLSVQKKKKHLAEFEADTVKKLTIATSICFPEMFFGVMFDEIWKPDEPEMQTLEENQTDYCITKYVISNNLIDTTLYEIDPNPNNIDTNFDCTDHIEDLFEELEEVITEQIQSETSHTRRQVRCMNRVLKAKEVAPFLAKYGVLSDLTLKDDQKNVLRKEFIQYMKELFTELVKCI